MDLIMLLIKPRIIILELEGHTGLLLINHQKDALRNRSQTPQIALPSLLKKQQDALFLYMEPIWIIALSVTLMSHCFMIMRK